VDEEVGLLLAHGLVDLHAAPIQVDAPALAGGVAAPEDVEVARLRRRRAEVTHERPIDRLEIGQVLEAHAIEDMLVRRQVGEVHPRREVGILERRRPHHALGVGEGIAGGILYDHAGGAVAAAPDHRAVGADVAGHDAAGQARQRRVAGRRQSGAAADDEGGADGERGRAAQERASRQENRSHCFLRFLDWLPPDYLSAPLQPIVTTLDDSMTPRGTLRP